MTGEIGQYELRDLNDTQLRAIITKAYGFAVVHMGDHDNLGVMAMELLALLQARYPANYEDFDKW